MFFTDEYNHIILAVIIISIILLGAYVVQCTKSEIKERKNQESAMTDRIDFLTRKINETSKSVKDYMESPVKSKTEEVSKKTEETIPDPVSSSFIS